MTQKIFSEKEKKVHYTVYLNESIADFIEKKANEVGISKNKLIEKYLKEINNYQHPYITIKNHLKIIEKHLHTIVEEEEEIFDNIFNVFLNWEEVHDTKEEQIILQEEKRRITLIKKKYEAILYSLRIIEDKINYI